MTVRIVRNGIYFQLRYRDSTGRVVGRSIGAVSAAEAERQRIKLAAELFSNPGRADVGRAPRLSGWRETFLEQRADDVKPETLGLFELTFDRLSQHFTTDPRIDQVSRAAAAGFAAWLRKQKARGSDRALSRQTVARHVRDCRVIFGRAADQDLIPFNPFDRVEAAAPAIAKKWANITREQTERLLTVLPGPGWRVLVGLCRFAGLRRGEALRLAWPDIDWVGRTLRVLPEANENDEREEGTKQRERVVPIEPRLHELLKEAQEAASDDQGAVCGLGENNLERTLQVYLKRAEIPKYAKPFHTLRKCLESEWMAVHPIMTVCYWLGHAPAVAARHYHRPTDAEIARVALESGAPGAGTNPVQNGADVKPAKQKQQDFSEKGR